MENNESKKYEKKQVKNTSYLGNSSSNPLSFGSNFDPSPNPVPLNRYAIYFNEDRYFAAGDICIDVPAKSYFSKYVNPCLNSQKTLNDIFLNVHFEHFDIDFVDIEKPESCRYILPNAKFQQVMDGSALVSFMYYKDKNRICQLDSKARLLYAVNGEALVIGTFRDENKSLKYTDEKGEKNTYNLYYDEEKNRYFITKDIFNNNIRYYFSTDNNLDIREKRFSPEDLKISFVDFNGFECISCSNTTFEKIINQEKFIKELRDKNKNITYGLYSLKTLEEDSKENILVNIVRYENQGLEYKLDSSVTLEEATKGEALVSSVRDKKKKILYKLDPKVKLEEATKGEALVSSVRDKKKKILYKLDPKVKLEEATKGEGFVSTVSDEDGQKILFLAFETKLREVLDRTALITSLSSKIKEYKRYDRCPLTLKEFFDSEESKNNQENNQEYIRELEFEDEKGEKNTYHLYYDEEKNRYFITKDIFNNNIRYYFSTDNNLDIREKRFSPEDLKISFADIGHSRYMFSDVGLKEALQKKALVSCVNHKKNRIDSYFDPIAFEEAIKGELLVKYVCRSSNKDMRYYLDEAKLKEVLDSEDVFVNYVFDKTTKLSYYLYNQLILERDTNGKMFSPNYTKSRLEEAMNGKEFVKCVVDDRDENERIIYYIYSRNKTFENFIKRKESIHGISADCQNKKLKYKFLPKETFDKVLNKTASVVSVSNTETGMKYDISKGATFEEVLNKTASVVSVSNTETGMKYDIDSQDCILKKVLNGSSFVNFAYDEKNQLKWYLCSKSTLEGGGGEFSIKPTLKEVANEEVLVESLYNKRTKLQYDLYDKEKLKRVLNGKLCFNNLYDKNKRLRYVLSSKVSLERLLNETLNVTYLYDTEGGIRYQFGRGVTLEEAFNKKGSICFIYDEERDLEYKVKTDTLESAINKKILVTTIIYKNNLLEFKPPKTLKEVLDGKAEVADVKHLKSCLLGKTPKTLKEVLDGKAEVADVKNLKNVVLDKIKISKTQDLYNEIDRIKRDYMDTLIIQAHYNKIKKFKIKIPKRQDLYNEIDRIKRDDMDRIKPDDMDTWSTQAQCNR